MKPVDSYSLLLISSLFFIFSQNQFNAYPTLLDQNCSVDNYYTDSCQLHSSNLNGLLTNKLRESDNNGFASSFAGVYPDEVYGLYLCSRGDVIQDDCQACIDQAGFGFRLKCSGSKVSFAMEKNSKADELHGGTVQSTLDLSAQDCQECLIIGHATTAPAIPPRPAISPLQDRTSSRSQSAKRTWITVVAGSARLAVVGSVALIGFIALIICQRKNARGT